MFTATRFIRYVLLSFFCILTLSANAHERTICILENDSSTVCKVCEGAFDALRWGVAIGGETVVEKGADLFCKTIVKHYTGVDCSAIIDKIIEMGADTIQNTDSTDFCKSIHLCNTKVIF